MTRAGLAGRGTDAADDSHVTDEAADAAGQSGEPQAQAWWEVRRTGADVEVPPGLVLNRRIIGSAIVGADEVPGLEAGQAVFINLVAVWREGARRYVVDEFTVQAKGGLEVTNAMLRTLPVQRFLRAVVASSVREPAGLAPSFGLEVIADFAPGRPRTSRFNRQLESEKSRRRPSDPQTIRDVAAVYRVAEITSEAPLRAVERAFGLERRTASNWIRRARDAGMLEEPA